MTPHNLPNSTTTFVGRQVELSEIAALLGDPACRLLTLLGAGGIGKTRLALQAASKLQGFSYGVYFVALAPVTSPNEIATAIASALGVVFTGLDETLTQIIHVLRDRSTLLLMDNFEHLIDGASMLSDILQTAPGVKIIVTSRERLNLQEEWVYAVNGLPVPAAKPAEPLENYDSVQLFVQRARQTQPNFSLLDNIEAVKTICQNVEGMPLGLELAATWLRAMPCAQVATRMAENLDFLTTPHRNIPERHRSLRTVFTYSWLMLSLTEQAVMAKLSVFRGGFDLDAAAEVTGATLSLLAGLVDKSLIRVNTEGRYDLHELLRQFAADQLSEKATDEALRQHFAYFLTFAEQVEAHEFGREQVSWFDRAETEMDNIRSALNWAFQHNESERGLRLVTALGWFLTERSHWTEGTSWLTQLVAAKGEIPPALHAKALMRAGALVGMLSNVSEATNYEEQALALAREHGDRWNMAWALAHLGLLREADVNENAQLLDEGIALFRELGDPMGLCHTLVRRTFLANHQRDYHLSGTLLEEAQSIAQAAGDTIMSAWVNCCLGDISWLHLQDLEQAKIHYSSSIMLFKQAHFYNVVIDIVSMQGHVERLLGNYREALALYEETFQLIDAKLTSDVHRYIFNEVTTVLIALANIAVRNHQPEHAATLLGAVSRYDLKELAEIATGIIAIEDDLAAIHTQLDDARFAAAWELGRTMTREQMVAFARSNNPLTESKPAPERRPPTAILTTRELSILQLLAAGHSNRTIAEQLILSPGTVKWYVSEILSKLGVTNRTQAVAQAQKLGLLASIEH